jgi:hypothetical protein
VLGVQRLLPTAESGDAFNKVGTSKMLAPEGEFYLKNISKK